MQNEAASTRQKVGSASLELLHPGLYRAAYQSALVPPAFPFGLGETGVHEVCEASFGDMAALTGFALAAARLRRGALVWISQRNLIMDHGGCLQAGLAQLRRGAPHILSIDVIRLSDALWTIEEAVRSSAVGGVVAEIGSMDFTASRRLALAAGRHGVPVILLMSYTCEGATAASARWRVSARPSAPNAFDARAPGNIRWRAVLERCRQAPGLAGKVFDLELNDETLSLSVVSAVASYAPAPRAARPVKGNQPDIRKRA